MRMKIKPTCKYRRCWDKSHTPTRAGVAGCQTMEKGPTPSRNFILILKELAPYDRGMAIYCGEDITTRAAGN